MNANPPPDDEPPITLSIPSVSMTGGWTPTDPTAVDPRAEVREQQGRYQVLGEIARGGMGVVYRGRDSLLDRDLAVKVLREGLGEQFEQRFFEEARVGGQLQHPGVVPVYDMGRLSNGSAYFTMKLVDGETLSTLLAKRQAISDDLPRFVQVFEHICQAMAYAHSRGIIHRDLKPANIMVGAFGEVQVMDWGLAKAIRENRPIDASSLQVASRDGELTVSGAVMGTPAYMAPEQARGEVVDARADVFGLGAILCVILTGRPPYESTSNVRELLASAATGKLDSARERLKDSGADEELIRICDACLAFAPEDRPANGAAVVERVQAYVAGVAERARQADRERVAAEARAAEERKRRRAQFALVGSALLATALGAFGLVAYRLRGEAESARTVAERERESADIARNTAESERAQADVARGEAVAASDQLAKQKKEVEAARDSLREANDRLAAIEYGQAVKLAEQDVRSNNIVSAKQNLDSGKERFRGWEWRYLRRQIEDGWRDVRAPEATIGYPSISPDGKLVLAVCYDGTTRIWDFQTGAERSSAKFAFGKPAHSTFTHDGKQYATLGASGGLEVRSVESGESLGKFPPNSPADTLNSTLVPVGRTMVLELIRNSSLLSRLIDTETGKVVRTWSRNVQVEAVAADGSIAVIQSAAGLQIESLVDGKLIADFAPTTDRPVLVFVSRDGSRILQIGYSGKLTSIDGKTGKPIAANFATCVSYGGALSPDGSIAATRSSGGVVRFWNMANGTELRSITFPLDVSSRLSFSKDGKFLIATAELGDVSWFCDVDRAEIVHTLRGKAGLPALSASNRSAVSLESPSGYVRMMRFWDLNQVAEPYSIFRIEGIGQRSYFGQFDPTGNHLLIVAGTQGKTIDLTSRSEKPVLCPKDTPSVDWGQLSADGSLGAIADSNGPRLFDLRTGEVLHSFGKTTNPQPGNRPFIQLSANGTRVFTSNVIGSEATAWNARTGAQEAQLQGYLFPGTPVSADGSRIVTKLTESADPPGRLTATSKRIARFALWDVNPVRKVCEYEIKCPYNTIDAPVFSPSGELLAASGFEDHSVRLFDTRSGQEVHRLMGHTVVPDKLLFSADGRRLASFGQQDIVRVWDVTSGKEKVRLSGIVGINGPKNGITSLAFHPTENRLATVGAVVQIWDTNTGTEVLVLGSELGRYALVGRAAFSPDGRRLMVVGNSRVLVWDAGPATK